MTRRPAALLAAAAAALASACTGTDVGNPAVDVDFAAYNLSTPTATVETATMEVERIRLRPADDCEGGSEIEIEGPFDVDLTTPTSIAELTDLDLAAQGYCRFELRWHPDDDTGLAITVSGDADGTPFAVRSRRNDELRLEATDADGFTIDEATSALFVAFDMAAWLDGVEVSGAELDGDGVAVIDDDVNRDLLDVFESNVTDAADLFDDGDGDGTLDDDEHDPGDELAEAAP
jgi:hypothetical protein